MDDNAPLVTLSILTYLKPMLPYYFFFSTSGSHLIPASFVWCWSPMASRIFAIASYIFTPEVNRHNRRAARSCVTNPFINSWHLAWHSKRKGCRSKPFSCITLQQTKPKQAKWPSAAQNLYGENHKKLIKNDLYEVEVNQDIARSPSLRRDGVHNYPECQIRLEKTTTLSHNLW